MQLRMGKKDGFANETTKKLHDVATRFILDAKLTIHENVVDFQEAFMHSCIVQSISA